MERYYWTALKARAGVDLVVSARAGRQERVEDWWVFTLRRAGTGDTVAELPAALVIAALAHYVAQAALSAELTPALSEALGVTLPLTFRRRAMPPEYAYPTHKKLRGAENRNLKGRARHEQRPT